MPEKSTDVFKGNIIDRYIDRSNWSLDSGKYSALGNFCFAEFLKYYYVPSTNSNENDYQPQELKDDIIEENLICQNYYHKLKKLL